MQAKWQDEPMPNHAQLNLFEQEISGLRSFDVTCEPHRLTVVEGSSRFRREAVLQAVARFAAVLLLPLAYALWFFPPMIGQLDPFTSRLMLFFAMLAAGFAAAVIARRGVRHAVAVDADALELQVFTVNSQGRPRGIRRVPLDHIVSLFVRRPAAPEIEAARAMRLSTDPEDVGLLRTTIGEAELLHEAFCRNIRRATIEAALPGASDRAVRSGLSARSQQVTGARAARRRARALIDAARQHAAEVASGREDELV